MSKTALVTGASGGLGLEFAKILAGDKYDLILISRTQSKLDEIAESFHRLYGVKVTAIGCDLSNAQDRLKVLEFIETRDIEIDILVNNAGIGDWGPFIDSHWTKQENMLQLNVIALTWLTHRVTSKMSKRGHGKILNVASMAAFQPGPLMSVYYASKAYVLSFSLAIAQELMETGVTVTCLCPGPTATGFQAVTFVKEIRLTRGQRLVTAQEVAQYGYKAMLKGQRVAVPGFLNRFILVIMRFIPQSIILRLIHFLQGSP